MNISSEIREFSRYLTGAVFFQLCGSRIFPARSPKKTGFWIRMQVKSLWDREYSKLVHLL